MIGVNYHVRIIAVEVFLLARLGLGTLVFLGAVSPYGVRVRGDVTIGIGIGWNISGIYGQYLSQAGCIGWHNADVA